MANLEVRGVRKVFPREDMEPLLVLDGLSLEVRDKEFLICLGPSGCGKSTLLYMIAGFEKPSEGELRMDARPIQGPGVARGIVFQEFVLFPWRTVLENVTLGLELRKMPREERLQRARDHLKLVGLGAFESVYPHTLSGGMKQRVAIARALANDPEVLLMDEPFGALDAQTRSILQEDLLRLWERSHKTVVFVTHSIDEALLLGDRVLIFSARPSRIKEEIVVDLPRPRDVSSPRFLKLRARARAALRVEVERAMAEQAMGNVT